MVCARCGSEILADGIYCHRCGTDQRESMGPVARLRLLRRSATQRKIAGVCGGIANYFLVDPVFVRIAWAIITLVPGAVFLGVLAYIAAWFMMPTDRVATSTS